MKISNVTILSTDLTNNTTKISFTISEATENVNIYLKINDEEYKEIFSNKTNETLEYTANVSRGVNNLLLKATDSTTEYISEPIQVLLKEAPSIKNLECSYSDSTGKYILNFAFNGDANFKYSIYLKLDTNDYIEVLSNQISGDKTIEQTSAMGEHTCTLKVSDGYNDYTFSPFQFEITNHKPILSKVLVTDITNDGEAYIYYSTKDIESSTLTHKLVIGSTETVITPNQVDNFYSYRVTGLSEGTSNCTISISDGTDIVSSDVFSIEVFSDTTDKKELLRRAKVRYDSAYQQLRDIIVSVISDLKYDYDIENALIAKAQDNYKIEYSNFNKISQQSIDAIGNNKVNVTKQELQSEINDVDNAVNSLETTMWGVFQDGVLDQSERDALSSSLDLVAKEKIDIDKDYEALYNNEDLIDPAKTKLQTNYNTFIEAHNSLATTINNIINKEGIIDNTDKTNIDTAFENWRTALGNYRTASLEAIDSIAKKKADDSADVVDKKWAEIVLDPETGIKSQVGSLQSKITGAGGIEERLRTTEQTLTTDGISNIVKDVYYTKTEVDNKVKTTVKSVNVMYYLSTSTTELIGGAWSDVAPTWEADKYMWSKTVTTLSDGTIKESSPTCIAGAKGEDGSDGTGIESITEEYYLSTSKTTQTGGSWVTTPPTWEYGKYIWIRSKIVYKDPASTVYTTPICDSSWEAVNEIEIGGRNLVLNSDVLNSTFSPIGTYKGTRTVVEDTEAKSKKHLEFKCTTAGSGFYNPIFDKSSDKIGKTYTWSFWAKCSVNKIGNVGHECGGRRAINLTTEWQKFTHTWVFTDAQYYSFTWYIQWEVGEILYVRDFKIEEGNKATDWSPAPEDIQNQIDENKTEVNTRMSVVEQTIDSWGVKITENENEIASLKLTNEEFEVAIGNKADSSNIISIINASTEGITISSSKVNISGFVTFSDLRNPNSYTTIHGSNIATKTISASDISTGTLTGCLLQTYSDSTSKGVRIAKESLSLNGTNFFYYSNDEFRIVSDQRFSVASVNDIYLMPGLNGNTGQTSGTGAVVIPDSTLRTQKLYVVDESNFTGDVTFNANIKLNGGLNCPRDIAVGRNMSVDGIAWIETLHVNGTASLGSLSVTNSSTLSSLSCTSISATGTVKTTGALQGGGISCSGNMSVDDTAWIKTLYVNGNYVTSDETLKTDIKYVNMDTQELTEDGLMSPNVNITTSDMHQFIETLPMVSYRLTEDVEKGEDNTYYGFLAQEILYTKVGSELIKIPNDNEKELIGDKLRYSENKFIAFICGALQEEIKQRKALERQLNDLINTINK